jgi:hypothetical protein
MTENENKPNSLEIPIISPSSPLVPLHIDEFVKDMNVPVDTKVNTNAPVITGGSTTETNTGIIGYFKSFFQRFSQSSNQQKKQESQDQSSFQKLFYSGDGIKKEEESTKEMEEEKEIETEEEETEITKIIITTTKDPEIVLRESLKGTKLYYFTERTELPSQWV